MKTKMSAALLLVLFVTGIAFGGQETLKNPDWATPYRIFQNMKIVIDYLYDSLNIPDVKLNDLRISPVIRSEEAIEIPMEFGLILPESQLINVFQKLQTFSFNETKFSFKAVTISVSAENLPDGHPILVMTVNMSICFGPAMSQWDVASRTQGIIQGFSHLLEKTTFTPQIEKKILREKGIQRSGSTWITNFRMDSDQRCQMTGYGLDPKVITKLGDTLLKTGSFFAETFISNLNKNVYEKVPVWRFDMHALMKGPK